MRSQKISERRNLFFNRSNQNLHQNNRLRILPIANCLLITSHFKHPIALLSLSFIFAHPKKIKIMEALKFFHQQVTTKKDHPDFKAGDNVTVHYKITEGNKERIQDYRGEVIQRKGSGSTQTFTVRKISNGVGVERVFPLFSPNIESIEMNKRGKVRRARLFYLRDLKGKKARIKEKRMNIEGAETLVATPEVAQ